MPSVDAVTPQELLDTILPPGKVSIVGLPFTGFLHDGSTVPAVNPAAVPHQAEVVKREALDAVLIGGTTDEWPSQSLAERVAIAKAWRLAIPVGGAVKLILHTGANALGDARDLAALAKTLEYDAVLCSSPTIFKASSLAAHCEAVAASIEPLGGACPVFYYHFPSLYNDDFPSLELCKALQKRSPEIVGAKLAGLQPEVVAQLIAMPNFASLATGVSSLTEHLSSPGLRGWIAYPWEAAACRTFMEVSAVHSSQIRESAGDLKIQLELRGTSSQPVAESELDELRNAVVGARPDVEPSGAYEISADKAFASAWYGFDLGPTRLPLLSCDVAELEPVLAAMRAKGLVAS